MRLEHSFETRRSCLDTGVNPNWEGLGDCFKNEKLCQQFCFMNVSQSKLANLTLQALQSGILGLRARIPHQ